jgi:hypothetical protein
VASVTVASATVASATVASVTVASPAAETALSTIALSSIIDIFSIFNNINNILIYFLCHFNLNKFKYQKYKN